AAAITNTMMVVIVVSLRVGQVTFWASARTSCRNLNGLTFAIGAIRSVKLKKLHSKMGIRRPNSTKDGTGKRSVLGECSPRKSVTGPQAMPLRTAQRSHRQGGVVTPRSPGTHGFSPRTTALSCVNCHIPRQIYGTRGHGIVLG